MKNYGYAILASCVIVIDQWTKWLIVHYLHQRMVLNSYLAFDQAINRGISWGMFNHANNMVFALITTIIIAVTIGLIVYLFYSISQKISAWGLTLVCAGSVSNVIDRLLRGGVIDFIEMSYGNFVWPNFNIADICIVIGVSIMLLEQYKTHKASHHN